MRKILGYVSLIALFGTYLFFVGPLSVETRDDAVLPDPLTQHCVSTSHSAVLHPNKALCRIVMQHCVIPLLSIVWNLHR